MKKTFFLFFAMVLSCAFSADAALVDRGGGLIYDTVLDVTWLQDANYAKTSGYDDDGQMTWEQAKTWASGLSYEDSVRNKTWSDWRLPEVGPVNGSSFNFSYTYDGSTDAGYNITSPNSELMYMYYVNLGNPGAYLSTPTGVDPVGDTNWGKFNPAEFVNLSRLPSDSSDASYRYYWSGVPKDSNYILAGNYYAGSQNAIAPGRLGFAWAVRDGDVVSAPIPGAAWLIGSGLVSLVALRRRLS